MSNFYNIENLKDLARVLNIPYKKITYVLYKKGVENQYTSFEIPKSDGSSRQIKAPEKDLKDIQKDLASILYDYQTYIWSSQRINNNVSHGFQRGKSIITNAERHRNKRFVLNVDLEDFFDSFHFGRVMGFFKKNKYFKLSEKISMAITQLSCYNGSLPQGAPTSPVITNLICNVLDMKIIKLAKQYKTNYTRYADDMTFSTNNKDFLKKKEDFFVELTGIVVKSGLKINEQKTRLIYLDSRQDVTGLVVNEKINVNKEFYKTTRAMAHSLYTKGKFNIDGAPGTIEQLEGRFSFIDQLDKYNNSKSKEINKDAKLDFYNLKAREKQYQQFLFYKYFFANDKPLIITEGKTDVLYIKSALKNLYQDYPKLINKDHNNFFDLNVSFLKRSKRLRHFLNIKSHGADTFKNVYNFFSEKHNEKFPNYSEIMQRTGMKPKNPVILIFDNELTNKNKPLKNFIKETNINDKEKLIQTLETQHYANVAYNLYIVTHQLVNGEKECEIEDLFDENTRSITINEQTFNRNNKHAKSNFADFISNNYLDINFNNFKYMLNRINTIIQKYEY